MGFDRLEIEPRRVATYEAYNSRRIFSSHLVTLVKAKNTVDVRDSVQAPHEDSALLCNKSGHILFVIFHLGIPINLPLALNTPSVWLADHWMASSDEAACSFWPDLEADLALDPEAWANSNPEAWLDSNPEE
ncbi:hypothetical protein H5410_021635 [Solanum commersonii]|uniref:Uncharacterized protein n=1 Tax=Solanum commersonii TaxID=4109 RepID=A0A9J5ZCH6_SOLCO|nr:hypothetical protein H5410_021635 [Solanum commersonii]